MQTMCQKFLRKYNFLNSLLLIVLRRGLRSVANYLKRYNNVFICILTYIIVFLSMKVPSERYRIF